MWGWVPALRVCVTTVRRCCQPGAAASWARGCHQDAAGLRIPPVTKTPVNCQPKFSLQLLLIPQRSRPATVALAASPLLPPEEDEEFPHPRGPGNGTRWHGRRSPASPAPLAGSPPAAPCPSPQQTRGQGATGQRVRCGAGHLLGVRGRSWRAGGSGSLSSGALGPSCLEASEGRLPVGRFPLMEYFILRERLNLCTERCGRAESAAGWGAAGSAISVWLQHSTSVPRSPAAALCQAASSPQRPAPTPLPAPPQEPQAAWVVGWHQPQPPRTARQPHATPLPCCRAPSEPSPLWHRWAAFLPPFLILLVTTRTGWQEVSQPQEHARALGSGPRPGHCPGLLSRRALLPDACPHCAGCPWQSRARVHAPPDAALICAGCEAEQEAERPLAARTHACTRGAGVRGPATTVVSQGTEW